MSTNNVRERILEYSMNKFFTYGFSRITMEGISSDLKISKRTLYKYFSNKYDLFEAVMENFYEQTAAGVNAVMNDKNMDYTDKLKAFLTFVCRQMIKLNSEFMKDIKDNVPKAWLLIESMRKKGIEKDFGILIKEGKKQGLIKNNYDDLLIMDIFLGAVEKAASPEILINRSISLTESVQSVITIILHGIVDHAKIHSKKY